MKAPEFNSSLRNSYQKLQQHFHETNTSQNALSAIGLALLNKVPEEIKRATNYYHHHHHYYCHYHYYYYSIIHFLMLIFSLF